MTLAGVIAISNLNPHKGNEIKILQVAIRLRKTTLTHLNGGEDGTTARLLFNKWEHLISLRPKFPMLSNTQAQALKELIKQISADADRAKTDLCQALSETSTECTRL